MIKIKLKNIISERATDEIYGKIADYFNEQLSDENNFYAKATVYGFKSKEYDGFVPAITIHFKSPPDWQKKFEEYKQFTGDDRIINSSMKYQLMMGKLRIYILPGIVRPDAGGDMSSKGVMRIFLHSWKPPVATADEIPRNMFNPSVEDIGTIWSKKEESTGVEVGRTARNLEKAIDGVKAGRFAKYIEDVLSHEIGHYINATRSIGDKDFKPRDFRAKGKSKQFDTSTKEYARSSEEWQARYTEALYQMQRAFKIKMPDLEKDIEIYNKRHADENVDYREIERKLQKKYEDILNSSGVPKQIFAALRVVPWDDFSTFSFEIKDFTGFYRHEPKLGVTAPKRINARLYSLFQELKKKLNEPLFKMFKIF